MSTYELNTTVANLSDLRQSSLESYDAIYLGDIYCRLYAENILERPADVKEGVRILHDQGKKAYVTSYAAPRNDFLPKVKRILGAAGDAGADAVEVHNLGVLRMAHETIPQMPVHIGGFANVYTAAGIEVLRQYGAVRFTPNYEVSLEEINEITADCGGTMEILLHGKMPLGVSDYCFLLEYDKKWGVHCPDLCRKELFLKQGDWAMKTLGKGVMSGKDVCMIEHLPQLLAAGHRNFRIETLSETPAYRAEVGSVYRRALDRALSGQENLDAEWSETLLRHAAIGLCNGFYFGKSGMDYTGIRPSAMGSLLTVSRVES